MSIIFFAILVFFMSRYERLELHKDIFLYVIKTALIIAKNYKYFILVEWQRPSMACTVNGPILYLCPTTSKLLFLPRKRGSDSKRINRCISNQDRKALRERRSRKKKFSSNTLPEQYRIFLNRSRGFYF